MLALVTGGARRLGRIFVRHLAMCGYDVVVHYHHSQAEAADLCGEIHTIGRKAWTFPADLRDPAAIAVLFEQVRALGRPLSVLVNSAAEMSPADLLAISPEEWDATLALNLRAPLLCAQAAVPLMDHGGLIVNVSDVGAGKVWTRYPAYVVSKSALETLTRLLARRLAPEIRVNALAPGLVLPSPEMPPEAWERLLARLPFPREIRAEELTAALDYLLTAPAVTGQVLTVAGGYDLI